MINIDWANEAEVNAFLRKGLMLANMPGEDILPVEFEYSPRYKSWEHKFLANHIGTEKKKSRPMWRRILKTAAVILLILTVSFGAVMAFNSDVRAAVMRWVFEHFQTHDTYRFVGEPSGQSIGQWYPTYLPDEYTEVERIDLDGYVIVRFENGSGDKIELNYQEITAGGLFHLDNEQMNRVEITADGVTFITYQSTEEYKSNLVLWEDEASQVMFLLSSFESCETLIRIAESMVATD